MPLSSADLNSLSDALAFARPDICAISRRGRGTDAGGAPIETWTTVASVGCRLEAGGSMPVETMVGAKPTNFFDYTINLPRGTDVRPSDRILVGTTVFEIVGVPGMESYAAEVAVRCKAVY